MTLCRHVCEILFKLSAEQVDWLRDVMATDVVGPPMKWVSHEIRHNETIYWDWNKPGLI